MSVKNPDAYNRLSFRSPLRKTNVIKKPDKPVILSPKPKMYNRVSCRSPIKVVKQDTNLYNVVTKTPGGDQVTVPTENKHSFIKFKESVLPKPVNVTILKELLPMKKRCSFEEALTIYENNQSYYLSKIKIGSEEEVIKILKEIDILEKWFCHIPEPRPKTSSEINEWKLRNKFKKDYGYSKYFDIDLISYTNYK